MSLTLSALLILVLDLVIKGLGLRFSNSEIETTVHVIVETAAAIAIWVGRVRAGGVSVLGFRLPSKK